MRKSQFDTLFRELNQDMANRVEYSYGWAELCSDPFYGIALHSKRVYATRLQSKYNLKYHCLFFNGTWDLSEIEVQREYFKRVDLID